MAAFAVTRGTLFVPRLSARVNLAPGAFGAEIFCFLLSLAISFALLPQPTKSSRQHLSDTTRRGGKLGVLLCIFILATQPIYAEICLDPFCCFGANSLLAALAVAALVLLALPAIIALADVLGVVGAFGVLGEIAFDSVLAVAPETVDSTIIEMVADQALTEGEAANLTTESNY